MTKHTATYSPEDNKLRMYPAHRLNPEDYARVKAAGFSWAPKQEIFVAPAWSPKREDLLLEMCGEIGDEDTTLVDRAEDRAARFDEYSTKREADARRARDAVAAIADNIPMDQPILIGHHSEKRARKDAERIENGMRAAVRLWDTAQYWAQRAAGAVSAAKYKERPDVRSRRIKKLEAEQRKIERLAAEAEQSARRWAAVDIPEKWKTDENGEKPSREARAFRIANVEHLIVATLPDGRKFTAYDVLRPVDERYRDCPAVSVDEILEKAAAAAAATAAYCARWRQHLVNRLSYERAMLADAGGTVTDQTKPEKGGAVRCLWAPRGGWAYIQKVNKVTVTILHRWNEGGRVFRHNEPLDKIHAVMSREQVEKARREGRITEIDERGFYLHDEPTTEPKPAAPKPTASDTSQGFDALRSQLRAGVQVVATPQLFPTPKELARRVVDLADIRPGHRVLEPSAGTGALLGAMGGRMFGHEPERGTVHAVEIDRRLAGKLQAEFPLTEVHAADFMAFQPDDFVPFDRIVMNPPFTNAQDIAHIKHAAEMLAPGGRLVAICAAGPRQREALAPLGRWEDLPPGSFAASGTDVNVALVIIDR